MKLKIQEVISSDGAHYDLEPDTKDTHPAWIVELSETEWKDYQRTRAEWLDWQSSLRHLHTKAAFVYDDAMDRERDLKKLAELKAKYE